MLQPPPRRPARLTRSCASAGAATLEDGGAAAEPRHPRLSSAEGVYVNGAYNALAVEFKDHIVVGRTQNVARGEAVFDEVKKVFPTKLIRYVVNTHPHSDHSSGCRRLSPKA